MGCGPAGIKPSNEVYGLDRSAFSDFRAATSLERPYIYTGDWISAFWYGYPWELEGVNRSTAGPFDGETEGIPPFLPCRSCRLQC